MRILVAEDNDDLRRAMVRMLETMGHEPVAFADGAQALAASLETDFDLVVSDLDMPVMSGIELHAQLPARLQRRFILQSGNYTELERLRSTIRVFPKGERAADFKRLVAEVLALEEPA